MNPQKYQLNTGDFATLAGVPKHVLIFMMTSVFLNPIILLIMDIDSILLTNTLLLLLSPS